MQTILKPRRERYRDLEKPASGALWKIPVAVAVYIPTRDGVTVDKELTGYSGTVASLQARVLRLARLTKWMLEESSRFHGYRDPKAKPSLGYQVVQWDTFFEDIPRGRPADDRGNFFPDYDGIVKKIGGKELVNRAGVKEFWIYHWHHGTLAPIETNMASRLSGDISNSHRVDDLTLYDRTYMVVGVNYNRGPDKHVHNIGHQMEAVLRWAAQRQDGNTDLFQRDFSGYDAQGRFQPGRAGNCHFPPNGEKDYDYFNKREVLSDIEDWNPMGTGKKKWVSCRTWETLPYKSPTGDSIYQKGSVLENDAWWYLYWFQNMPGWNSKIPHPKGEMTNWWRFLGDWDGAFREKYGLWKPTR